jgi:cytochrome c peroxidase
MKLRRFVGVLTPVLFSCVLGAALSGQGPNPGSGKDTGNNKKTGQQLFEAETFGGNGRTCLTCHSQKTGTVSPQDAQNRFAANPHDPLFLHDGSDDGHGNGVARMLADATVLITIPLPPNVRLADSTDRFVTLRRGIATTLNTPALDPVLMLDGRQATLELQAAGAIDNHAAGDEPHAERP